MRAILAPIRCGRRGLTPALGDMKLSPKELEEWASTYITASLSPDHLKDDYPLWWAIDRFMDPMTPDWAENCWMAILKILQHAPPNEVLEVLAAGPLEDLIGAQGPLFIDRIEKEARCNPAFHALLGGVWQSGTEELWERVEKVRGEPW